MSDPKQIRPFLSEIRPLVPDPAAFACLGLAILVVAALFIRGPAYIDPWSSVPPILLSTLLVVFAVIKLRLFGTRHPLVARLAVLLFGFAYLEMSWNIIRLLNHTTMTLALPFADRLLASWDQALGLDWPGYFHFVASNPILREVLGRSYTSLTVLSVIAYVAVTLFLDLRRSHFFLETFTIVATLCTLFGALLPARGTVDFYLGPHVDLSGFGVEPGRFFIEPLERLREGIPVELFLGNLPGLVTFPSFHVAAGALMMMATWRTRLFLPVALYSCVMFAATPIYGGHYFVDLIAGAAFAGIVALFWARRPRYGPIFRKSDV